MQIQVNTFQLFVYIRPRDEGMHKDIIGNLFCFFFIASFYS
jgi:hypothetical protein